MYSFSKSLPFSEKICRLYRLTLKDCVSADTKQIIFKAVTNTIQGSRLQFFAAPVPMAKSMFFSPIPDEKFPIWPSPFGPKNLSCFDCKWVENVVNDVIYFQQNHLQVWSLSLEQRTAAFQLDRPSCFVTGALLGTGLCILLSVRDLLPFPRRTWANSSTRSYFLFKYHCGKLYLV